MNFSLKSSVLLAVFLVAPAFGCEFGSPKVWIEDTQELDIPLEGIKTFLVKSHNGYVHVSGDSHSETAKVTITIKAGGKNDDDAQECFDTLSLKSEKDGDAHLLSMQWSVKKKSHWSATVSYDVELPRNLALKVNTHNGEIKVDGLRGKCDLHTHNGDIEVKDVRADVDASTHNGYLAVQAVAPYIRLKTHNGAIDAELAGVETVDGKIETHNGAVRLQLGEGASTQLTCRTYNGGISNSLALNDVQKKKRSLRGTLGSGAGELKIVTHNGSITLLE